MGAKQYHVSIAVVVDCDGEMSPSQLFSVLCRRLYDMSLGSSRDDVETFTTTYPERNGTIEMRDFGVYNATQDVLNVMRIASMKPLPNDPLMDILQHDTSNTDTSTDDKESTTNA
jgi:hypothetical protein